MDPSPGIREARREDLPAIMRIRMAVKENRLVSRVIPESEVLDYLERRGQGWVALQDGEVVGFAIADGIDGSVWALFVDPGHEARGHGGRLHDAMLAWFWSRGHRQVHLGTGADTRARRFYELRGWTEVGRLANGDAEMRIEAPGLRSMTPAGIVREFWRLMASNDFASVAAVLAEDFVLDWPQSGERIRGADNFARMNADYPAHGPWRFTLRRLLAEGDEVASEVEVTDGVQTALAISFFTVEEGKITGLVEYWPEPFAAPAWRAPLVEAGTRMG